MAEVNVQKKHDGQGQPESSGIATREPSHATRAGWPSSPFRRDLFSANPFTLMRRLNEEMDRAFGWVGLGSRNQSEWMPAIDVAERNGELQVHADLPGMEKNDVQVEVSGNILSISGKREQQHEEDSEGVHRVERSYGRFYRAIPLPEGAKIDQARAEFNNGVLEIRLPLEASRQNSRQIPIGTGASAQSRENSSEVSTSSQTGQGTPASRTGTQTADPASLGKEIASHQSKVA